jgi:hypothetical protein
MKYLKFWLRIYSDSRKEQRTIEASIENANKVIAELSLWVWCAERGKYIK